MATSKRKVYEFLTGHPLGVVGTVAASQEPWSAPVYFAADEKLNFFFLTKTATTKYDNMKENPQVSLVIADNKEQVTVQGFGIAKQMTDESEIVSAYDKLAHIMPPGELSWTPPVTKVREGEYALMKVTPEVLHYADFKGRHPHKTPIEQII